MLKLIFYIITFFILSIEIGIASDDVIQFLDSKSDEYAHTRSRISNKDTFTMAA